MRAAQTRGRTVQAGLAALVIVSLPFVFASGPLSGSASAEDFAGAEAQRRRAAAPAGEAEPWVIAPRRAATPNPVPLTDAAVAKGGELYQRECATCHGDNGQNDGPGAKNVDDMHLARVLTDPTLQEESDGSLYWKITEGRGGMASMEKEFSDEERWMLVHFLRTLKAP